MRVRDVMTDIVLIAGPEHTIREVAQLMSARQIGSAVIVDPTAAPGTGILTERDVLNVIGRGLDPDLERVAGHLTWDVVYASPSWTCEEAAAVMLDCGFRHLIVVDGDEPLGIVSVRDLVRAWLGRPNAPRKGRPIGHGPVNDLANLQYANQQPAWRTIASLPQPPTQIADITPTEASTT